jgi:NAD(P)-dependent dehydrogenase (short-subunit alcohol dehydrogenase family)
MEIYAVKHLAGTLLPVEKAGVIINVLCPGLCTTELVRNMPEEQYNAVRELQRLCGRTAEDGSRTLLQAVMAGKESHGRLQHSCEDGE